MHVTDTTTLCYVQTSGIRRLLFVFFFLSLSFRHTQSNSSLFLFSLFSINQILVITVLAPTSSFSNLVFAFFPRRLPASSFFIRPATTEQFRDMLVAWFFFVALVSTSALADHTNFGQNDTDTLLRIKNSISHDPSNLLSSWTPDISHCNWYGVTCDKSSDKVTALNFTSGNSDPALVGILSQSIGDLSELQALVIAHNAFFGEIPVSVTSLQFLEILELQGNNFSGTIPGQIIFLQSLRRLNLSFNSFIGEIPDGLIGHGKLEVVDLSNNQLSGGIKIDTSSECWSLRHLKLSNNVLNKSIPKEIGVCKNLRTLLLDGNCLPGRIPEEIGKISELRVLDVSTNFLTENIPVQLGNCSKLSVLILTNTSNFDGTGNGDMDDHNVMEFNSFAGGIPYSVFELPNLQILWAPRANLGGKLPAYWNDSCSLRVVHLSLNYFKGVVPEGMGMCKNLTFLDLSSNHLVSYLPVQLQVPCMVYFNISRNNLTGVLPIFKKGGCFTRMISFGEDLNPLDVEDVQIAYSNIPVWGPQMAIPMMEHDYVIAHDFSWNQFVGPLPLFSLGDEFLAAKIKPGYRLLLNNNFLDGPLPNDLVSNCKDLASFSLNLSSNYVSGKINDSLLLNCAPLTRFEAAYNQIGGLLPPSIGNLQMLQHFDLRGNELSGILPNQLGNLRHVNMILLRSNNLEGVIPPELGQLTALSVLDLSYNGIIGSIPANLSNAKNLEIALLNNNELSGEIPSSLSTLTNLTVLDVSFNNLSGPIPHFRHPIDCHSFKGNKFLEACSVSSPGQIPDPNGYGQQLRHRKNKSFIIALVTAASVAFCISLVVAVVSIHGRRKFSRSSNLGGKVIVIFADAPTELSYDNVVRATGYFSMRNLIGTGGFGSTYKAELAPGYLVAVKRLSLGRFQGVQQFDAEIRTLGRIRHKNLVTLIGYYADESEMFLIYNYLSGGNLETFIHERSNKNVQWSVIHKIAFDIAQALAYLHCSCVPRILHRDIKPSNILLDEELNVYLSDFGLAKLLEVSQTHATTDVAGTFGYVAPEYATTCRVSDKSDVYSFGVVLLELMSGKKSLDPSFSEYGNGFNIVTWARLKMKDGHPSEFFSSELWEAGPKENLLGMLKLASNCTLESLSGRPSMKQVLEKLKHLKS